MDNIVEANAASDSAVIKCVHSLPVAVISVM